MINEPEWVELHETEEERRINDLIDYWHLFYVGSEELHEFLGWTWEEYTNWIRTNEAPRA